MWKFESEEERKKERKTEREHTNLLTQNHHACRRRNRSKIARHEARDACLPRCVDERDLLVEVPGADGRDDDVVAPECVHERIPGAVQICGDDLGAALLDGVGLVAAYGGRARERRDLLRGGRDLLVRNLSRGEIG